MPLWTLKVGPTKQNMFQNVWKPGLTKKVITKIMYFYVQWSKTLFSFYTYHPITKYMDLIPADVKIKNMNERKDKN